MLYKKIEELPTTIPVFPLAGALLLPEAELPLNIFEPRYLAMIGDTMTGGRVIGIVQPTDPYTDHQKPPVYQIGCAGRVSEFQETKDGCILISLTGVCRFNIVHELPTDEPYRLAAVSYERFKDDLNIGLDNGFNDPLFLPTLRAYFGAKDLSADWNALEKLPGNALLTSLAMLCPFAPNEKQALLEASSNNERGQIMTTLMEMSVRETKDGALLQ